MTAPLSPQGQAAWSSPDHLSRIVDALGAALVHQLLRQANPPPALAAAARLQIVRTAQVRGAALTLLQNAEKAGLICAARGGLAAALSAHPAPNLRLLPALELVAPGAERAALIAFLAGKGFGPARLLTGRVRRALWGSLYRDGLPPARPPRTLLRLDVAFLPDPPLERAKVGEAQIPLLAARTRVEERRRAVRGAALTPGAWLRALFDLGGEPALSQLPPGAQAQAQRLFYELDARALPRLRRLTGERPAAATLQLEAAIS